MAQGCRNIHLSELGDQQICDGSAAFYNSITLFKERTVFRNRTGHAGYIKRKGEWNMLLYDIWKDVKAVQERDPAARSALEVLILYQGIHALIWHRIAHWLWLHHMRFAARLISQLARFFTLIEIHPGASLGHGILIDHGCGVVIGETAVVGDNCTIYQGVTLGGVGTRKGKRHPTIGNDVMIGAGAKILGAFEVGDHCAIASNAVLLKPLEENSTAAGVPARAVKIDGVPVADKKKAVTMEHYCQMQDTIEKLKKQVEELQNMIEYRTDPGRPPMHPVSGKKKSREGRIKDGSRN